MNDAVHSSGRTGHHHPMNTPQETVTEDLSTYPDSAATDVNDGAFAYCGPTADHILRLEARILELEKNQQVEPFRPSKVQAGSASIDTRPGLSVSDVVELARALRGSE